MTEPQPIATAPRDGHVLFVGNSGHVARSFCFADGPWQAVNDQGEVEPLGFEPTHWGWRRDDLNMPREQGGECELCGRPVEVGQVVLPYDDIGEAHADCANPYSLAVERGDDSPEPVLLLGNPMRHFPLPSEPA